MPARRPAPRAASFGIRHGASARGRRLGRRPAGAGHAAAPNAARSGTCRCGCPPLFHLRRDQRRRAAGERLHQQLEPARRTARSGDTDYGRLLLLKIGLFAAMLGIAAVNRFHLTPQLGARGISRSLARNSLAETGLGLCVLLFVGALGTMAPPRHDHVISNSADPSGRRLRAYPYR